MKLRQRHQVMAHVGPCEACDCRRFVAYWTVGREWMCNCGHAEAGHALVEVDLWMATRGRAWLSIACRVSIRGR